MILLRRHDLSVPREPCALAIRSLLIPSKHSGLPQLLSYKQGARITSLEPTLPRSLASVHSKGLTENLSPLESALTKNIGGGGVLLLTRNLQKNSIPRSIATKDLPWNLMG